MVSDNHEALVADFGLSSLVDDIRTRSRTTGGHVKIDGTPFWVAPEVLDGIMKISTKSDIYSMGLTFWEVR